MIDADQQGAELLAVGDNAADRHAAEADAVIAALAADQPHARALAPDFMKSERDLERGVDRLGARIAEEHVIEIAGGERSDAGGEFERLGMRELEGRGEVELGGLGLDRGHDRVAVVPGIGAPQAGGAVDQLAPLRRDVMHVLGGGDQPRAPLESTVGGERQPEGFEIVGNRGGRGVRCCLRPCGASCSGCHAPRRRGIQ